MLTKTIFNSFIWRAITIFANLANSILLARLLNVEQRGLYTLVILTTTLVVLFANFGIPDATIYLIGKNTKEKELTIGNGILLNFLTSVIVTIICYILLINENLFGLESRFVYAIAFISIIPLSINTQLKLTFLGLNEIVLYNKLMAMDIVILSFWFICSYFSFPGFDLTTATFAYVGSSFSIFILNIFILRTKIHFSMKFAGWQFFFEFLKKGKQFFFIGIGAFILQRINYKLLEVFTGIKAVGLLTIASSIPTLFYIFPSQLAAILYPIIANTKDNLQSEEILSKFFKLTVYLSIFIILIVAPFLGTITTSVFGIQYNNLGFIGVLLMISALLTGCCNILINYLSGIGRPELGTIWTILNIISIIIFGVTLIPFYGLVGSVIAKLIVDILSFIFLITKFHRITGIPFSKYSIINKNDIKMVINECRNFNF